MNISRKALDNYSQALKLEEEFKKSIEELNNVDLGKSRFEEEYGERIVLKLKDSNNKDLKFALQDEGVRRGGKHNINSILPTDLKGIIIESLKNSLTKHYTELIKEAKQQFKQELLGED